MLSYQLMLHSKPDMEVCLICGTNILLDHRMMDEHGRPIHTFILAATKNNSC